MLRHTFRRLALNSQAPGLTVGSAPALIIARTTTTNPDDNGAAVLGSPGHLPNMAPVPQPDLGLKGFPFGDELRDPAPAGLASAGDPTPSHYRDTADANTAKLYRPDSAAPAKDAHYEVPRTNPASQSAPNPQAKVDPQTVGAVKPQPQASSHVNFQTIDTHVDKGAPSGNKPSSKPPAGAEADSPPSASFPA